MACLAVHNGLLENVGSYAHPINYCSTMIKYFFGALFETYVFQAILYHAMRSSNPFSPLKYVLLSSILFGFAHIFNMDFNGYFSVEITRILMLCCAGIVYATSYYILMKKGKAAFVWVALMHFIYNMGVLNASYFFQ